MTPRCLFDLWALGIIRGPASAALPQASGKVPETHSVGPICDHDFGVFTVTNITTENTDAVPPAHPVPRMPNAADQGLQRWRGPRVPLTCLAPLAAWQSLCTGHVDASLGKFCALFQPSGTAGATVTDLPSALRRSARLPNATAGPTRKRAEAFHPRTLRTHYENVLRWTSGKEKFYRFKSGVNRPPLDPSDRRLRRRRLAGPPSGP